MIDFATDVGYDGIWFKCGTLFFMFFVLFFI